MNAFDLVDLRFPVEIGGRRFHVRRLRLGDVLRILVRFDERAREFASAERPDAAVFLASFSVEDTAELFAFALDPYAPAFLKANLTKDTKNKQVEIAILIRAANDIGRIWSSLKVGAAPAPKLDAIPPPSPVPPLLRVVDQLARRYGVSPVSVMDWPYEAFLTMVELVEDSLGQEREARFNLGLPMPDGSTLDYDLVDDSGIEVADMTDFNRRVN